MKANMKKCLMLGIAFILLFTAGNITKPVYAAGQPVAAISVPYWWIPQNISGVSTAKWSTSANAVYDYSTYFKPYSGWPAIDYTNSTGHASGQDRVLRQAQVKIYVLDSSTGSAMSGKTVTLSSSLGSNAYVKNPTSSTASDGYTTGYIEFYGVSSFTITATVDGYSYSTTVTPGSSTYYNRFLLTEYNSALWSRSGSDTAFKADVCLQGSGYDDRSSVLKWYRAVVSGNTCTGITEGSATTASGTSPTEYRTMAVDSPYITRKNYYDSSWYRGRVSFAGLSATSDSGVRTAEDSGGAINGYHIDIYIGFKTISQFSTAHPSLPTDTGRYFVTGTYLSTLRTVLQ
ncbi:hypothetical protein [Gorillibacterium sp. sgz500922]|uniref:hypothetical protein n=1 Tax=Gorillibacterium sp. sgz500922 TaxID=3446694 RepID=UPI003F66F017